jgi:hypothetical protein
MEKIVGRNDDAASQPEPDVSATLEDGVAPLRKRKHYSFYLSILMLTMIALIVAWDVTALSLALPVSLWPGCMDNYD